MWTLAKILDNCADMNNEHFHTFAIKKDGEVVGELKWVRRWKSAGGPAWEAKMFSDMPGCAGICYYNKNKSAVLEQVKSRH